MKEYVYKILGGCDKFYIGQSKRNICDKSYIGQTKIGIEKLVLYAETICSNQRIIRNLAKYLISLGQKATKCQISFKCVDVFKNLIV